MNNYIKSNQENRIFLENNEDNILKYIDEKGDYYLNIFKGTKNKINFCALFLGPLWMGYRQMYFETFLIGCFISILGSLLMLFELFISAAIIPDFVFKSLNYSLMGLVGFFGNYIYFLSLKKRIIENNQKIGVSKLGILYGFLLGVLMPMFIVGVIGFLVTLFIFGV